MIKTIIVILTFTLLSNNGFSQKVVTLDSSFSENSMTSQWATIEEKTENTSFDTIKTRKDWNNHQSIPISFGKDVRVVWLKTTVKNTSNQNINLRIVTKGIDSLRFFDNILNSNIRNLTGNHIKLSDRFLPSQYLVIPFSLAPKQSKTIYVRIYTQAYHLGLPFLKLMNPFQTNFYIKQGETIYNIYLGSLLVMMIFSLVMLGFYHEKLYLYYFFCLVWTFLIAFCNNDFLYFFTDTLPVFVRNKNEFATFLCFSNISYLLLSEQYFKIDTNRVKVLYWISRGSIIVTLILLVILISLGETLYYYRNLFYPLITINAVITYCYLFISFRKDYAPSWFFLAATAPIVLVSTMDVSSDINGIPIQTLHDYFYIGSFLEICFLFVGIVYRFKLERLHLESMRREIFRIETVTQDVERERIARELHDSVGHQILQSKYYFTSIQSHLILPDELKKEYHKKVEELSITYQNLMKIPSALNPKFLKNNDLLQEIRELYTHYNSPVFRLSLPENPLVLPSVVQEHLFRIITESVQNILKHAKATEIGIDIMDDEKEFRLVIDDNGIGFDTKSDYRNGMGLKSLVYRAEQELHGKLTIESSPGNGTIVLFRAKKKDFQKVKL